MPILAEQTFTRTFCCQPLACRFFRMVVNCIFSILFNDYYSKYSLVMQHIISYTIGIIGSLTIYYFIYLYLVQEFQMRELSRDGKVT